MNTHIIIESVLMLLSKLVRVCGNYSFPKLARFLRHSVYTDSVRAATWRMAVY